MDDLGWACIVAIVAIVALALVFKPQQVQAAETGVTYTYDDQNRIQAIIPLNNNVRLKPI